MYSVMEAIMMPMWRTFFNFTKTKDQRFFIAGSGVLSQKIYWGDATDFGHTYNVNLGKISGNWSYQVGHGVESENYDPNDMGFLFSPNEQYYYVQGGFTEYKPKNEKLQRYSIEGSSVYSRLYNPNVSFLTLVLILKGLWCGKRVLP